MTEESANEPAVEQVPGGEETKAPYAAATYAEWLKKMKHHRAYCVECLQYWQKLYGEPFVRVIRKEYAKLCKQ